MENKNYPIIVDAEAGKTYAFCTCLNSKIFPFCDGSHGQSGKIPIVQTMTETTKIAICTCRKSDNYFCNGSHTKPTE